MDNLVEMEDRVQRHAKAQSFRLSGWRKTPSMGHNRTKQVAVEAPPVNVNGMVAVVLGSVLDRERVALENVRERARQLPGRVHETVDKLLGPPGVTRSANLNSEEIRVQA